MKTSTIASSMAAAAGSAHAQQSAYGQCGGTDWKGQTSCVQGWTCNLYNPYYAQCIQATGTAPLATGTAPLVTGTAPTGYNTTSYTWPTSTSLVTVTRTSTVSAASLYETSVVSSAAYSSAETLVLSSVATYPTAAITTTSSVSSTVASSASAASTTATGKVTYAGINISGFDFGCSTDGTCTLSGITDPGTNGIDQIKHFVTDDGLNAFRLPVGWQYLVNSELGGDLDAINFAAYDKLVQGCLDAGAEMCIIDIHNYARWNGNIIGQGGPTNAQFSDLWSQLAAKYANSTHVVFGLMNEPHGVPSIGEWSVTVQSAVTAIRQIGATSNTILIPGNDWTHAEEFPTNSGPYLLNVTNLDGSTDNLIFDVHQYLDSDGSGTSTSCATNNVDIFSTLGDWLRTNKRQAILTETGGGATDSSCLTDLCQQFNEINKYSDVFMGWLGWAAGAFATSYALSETPTQSGSTWTDQELVTQCVVGMFKGNSTS
ncbi:Endoglucanase EG-II [Teratosphaeria destructans]|uniref:Endoglucanase EG-II n=1 Tax=Teratosphaeria destructans TaxID=418781 RepID=A0A9W7W4F4_9PEZI|nr:Endoglucanase EG-II [Teratosphaeria destructans]